MIRKPISGAMLGYTPPALMLLSLLLLGSSCSYTAAATGTATKGLVRARNLQTAAWTGGTSYQPSGLQSGPDRIGSSFASAMLYHSEDHTVTIVGSTYGTFFASTALGSDPGDDADGAGNSACFMATASLPSPDTVDCLVEDCSRSTGRGSGGNTDNAFRDDTAQQMEWLNVQIFAGASDITESCNSLLQHKGHLFASGYTEKGGVLEDLRNVGTLPNTKQFGMILDLQYSTQNNSTIDKTYDIQLLGGRVLQESEVVYPVAMTTSPSDDFIYVVTMETSDPSRNAMAANDTSPGGPNSAAAALTLHGDPTRFFTYGSNFGMSIERLEMKDPAESDGDASLKNTLLESWREMYVTNGGESVHVSDMAKLSDDLLIVVGSTTGYGKAFGSELDTGDDMDGFVTKLRTDVGTIYKDWSNPENNPSSTRIQSVNGQDDWVMGICHDPKDPEHFFLVGATRGQLGAATAGSTADPSTQAYLMKVEVSSLKPVWTTQIGADTAEDDSTVVHAGSCAVTSDGATVYMGGVVKDDAVLPGSGVEKSFGFDDIFVVQMDSQDGAVQWSRQIGSDGDDEFSRSGIKTDAAGNAIVLGNTVGSMYRKRTDDEEPPNSDVFLMTIARFNGDFQRLGGESDIFDNPVPATTPVPAPAPAPAPITAATSTSDDDDDRNKTRYAAMMSFLLVSIVGVLLLAVFVGRRMPREVNTDRAEVLGYLAEFDVEDIDLKHSATGGWHCNYANSLAEGVNIGPAAIDGGIMSNNNDSNNSNNDGSSNADFAPLNASAYKSNNKNSSLLNDSLFMDEDEPVMLGGFDGSGGSGRTSGYGGLVDAYNSRSGSSFDEESSSSQSRRKTDTWGREII